VIFEKLSHFRPSLGFGCAQVAVFRFDATAFVQSDDKVPFFVSDCIFDFAVVIATVGQNNYMLGTMFANVIKQV
jgi:hypothetical protein